MSFPVPCFGVVAESFEGEDGELSLNEGEKVLVVRCDEDGWFSLLTTTATARGIFPGSYLDPLHHINLPKQGKMMTEALDIGALPGDDVTVQDIVEEGILVENNSQITIVPWSAVDIDSKITPKRAVITPKRNDDKGSIAGVAPTRPISLVEPKPISVGAKVVLQKHPQKNSTAAPQVKRVSVAPNKTPPISSQTMRSPAKTSNTTNRPTKAPKKEAAPGEIHTSRFSTYRRPVSIFGDVLQHDMGTIKEVANLYKVTTEGAPRFELEGRFEFRATSDIPPPPGFQNVEKNYVTGQPSYVDWESKKRSAVFDI